jgi:hypothetical protein
VLPEGTPEPKRRGFLPDTVNRWQVFGSVASVVSVVVALVFGFAQLAGGDNQAAGRGAGQTTGPGPTPPDPTATQTAVPTWTPSTAPPPTIRTRNAYITEVGELCRQMHEDIQGIENYAQPPPRPPEGDVAVYVPWSRRYIAAERAMISRWREVAVPPADTSLVKDMQTLAEQATGKVLSAMLAWERGDYSQARQLENDAHNIFKQYDEQIQQYGLPQSCLM